MFVRTPRLLLRPGWAEDASALARAIGEEAIVRNLSTAPWPYSQADAEAFLARDTDPLMPSFLVFARTQGAPRLVGGAGLSPDPEGKGAQLGYWIARPHWGLGYATEAGRAVLDVAQAIGISELTARHFLDNPASGRVLRKLGFRPTGHVSMLHSSGRGKAAAAALYARDEDDAMRPRESSGVRWTNPAKIRTVRQREPASAAA